MKHIESIRDIYNKLEGFYSTVTTKKIYIDNGKSFDIIWTLNFQGVNSGWNSGDDKNDVKTSASEKLMVIRLEDLRSEFVLNSWE